MQRRGRGAVARVAPGLLLCAAIALAALALQRVETRLLGHPFVEALVLAILVGTAVRTAWTPGPRWTPGIGLGAKGVLELAIVLLGASVSYATLATAGWALLGGIVLVVGAAIGASYAISRLLGLSHRVALLIACGNSICGNSAIAAVAPVIGADSDDVAAAIAFTAILGVAVVLGLPLLIPALGLSAVQYGVLAGLTVYAVPQVLAATLPVSAVSGQVGTVVKLVRVLMLGPVVLALSLGRHGDAGGPRPRLGRLVPWFITGFLLLALLRSLGVIPPSIAGPARQAATLLTVLAMAALGLGVDVRAVRRVGPRATVAVTLSLVVLGGISVGLIRVLGVR